MIEIDLINLLTIIAFSLSWYLLCAGTKKLVEAKVMLKRQKGEGID